MGLKLTIEWTDELFTIDGVMVRRWKGTTEDGTPCTVFVNMVAVPWNADQSLFKPLTIEQHPERIERVPADAIASSPENG